MREFRTSKDGKPRFYQLDNSHLLIIDAQGYHEFCGHCKRLVFEYLGNGMHTTLACGCPSVTTDQIVEQLWHTLDQCKDIEAVKRMLMMFVSKREMSHGE